MKRPTKKRNSCFFLAALISLIVCVFAVSEGRTQDGSADANASYHYSPKGKIDPFKPLVREIVAVKKAERPRPTAGLTALERFNLEQLKLVGIGSYEKTRIAVVTDPKGKSYILVRGSSIGPNRGKVADILTDQIIVEEELSGEGRRKFRRIPLLLYKEESEDR
ncbi:MAG: pilus assembly protein PilP [Syntrophaceae bacterium]